MRFHGNRCDKANCRCLADKRWRHKYMKSKQKRSKEIHAEIREILLKEWDPVGVGDIAEASDEYDGYIGGIYRLLALGADESKIVEHLYHIETAYMGLSLKKQRLHVVAQSLKRVEIALGS